MINEIKLQSKPIKLPLFNIKKNCLCSLKHICDATCVLKTTDASEKALYVSVKLSSSRFNHQYIPNLHTWTWIGPSKVNIPVSLAFPNMLQPPTGLLLYEGDFFFPPVWQGGGMLKITLDVTWCSSGGNLWLQALINFSNSLGCVLYYSGNVVCPFFYLFTTGGWGGVLQNLWWVRTSLDEAILRKKNQQPESADEDMLKCNMMFGLFCLIHVPEPPLLQPAGVICHVYASSVKTP